MASNPPLPPASSINASSHYLDDGVTVRLITLSDVIRRDGGDSPQRLSAQVTGQNNDGTLTLRTDKGDIQILLKDKGQIPIGARIEIDIPAGRTPQNALIRLMPATTLSLANNSLPPSSFIAPSLSSPPASAPLNASTLGTAITTGQISSPIKTTAPIASGVLQAGQMVRLNPLPPAVLSSLLNKGGTPPMDAVAVLSSLITMIDTLPKEVGGARTTLINLLARMGENPLTALSQNNPSAAPLVNHALSLIQSSQQESLAPLAQNPLPSLIRPDKPLDIMVMALPSSLTSSLTPPKEFTGANIMPAQIIAMDDEGLPVLSLPFLKTASSAPSFPAAPLYTMSFRPSTITVGMPLLIAVQGGTGDTSAIPPPLMPPVADMKTALTHTAHTDLFGVDSLWGSFDSLLKSMVHMGHEAHDKTAAVNTTLGSMIPSPAHPQSMAALTLLFLSALRAGAIDEWFPSDVTQSLKQMERLEALKAVTADMAMGSKIDATPLPHDWRMTMIPLLWGQDIHRTALYYKHFREDQGEQTSDDDKKRRKLRFLFDLNLSRMGGVQVDGFMQSERLDLILRTHTPLSRPMQSQMKQLYAGAVEKSRLTGDLSFQFRPEHWVDFSKPFEKSGLMM